LNPARSARAASSFTVREGEGPSLFRLPHQRPVMTKTRSAVSARRSGIARKSRAAARMKVFAACLPGGRAGTADNSRGLDLARADLD